MARQISFFPSNENTTTGSAPFPVCRIWAYGGIEIERIVNTRRNPLGWVERTTRTIRYDNASKASEGRLHRAVANRLNKGQANISFIHGTLGLGYEVEL